ncbi:DNA repair protein Rev1 isoform X2 [Ostrinia nubilalis]|uniref:DNA repair protein Rev1 isoform X2 n=1 Tax=Ostrinia nubilalis TaxID=29057 RepID=UPI00308253B2
MRRRDENFPDNGFEAWGGYMQAKISKLEEQFSVQACKNDKLTNIFGGVSIYVNGFTIPSAEELKELMALHGGVYHTYQRAEDFIIASNLPDTKVKNMSLSRVIKPEWITDSIAANQLQDYKNYLLYRNSRTQPQLNFHKNVKHEVSKVENVHLEESTVPNSNILFKDDEEPVKPVAAVNNLDIMCNETKHIPTNVTSNDFVIDQSYVANL